MATQFGYFLIADITGYTHYLSESELDHAQKILTALIGELINHTKPPLVISRLAGDAVISYGLRESFLKGQTFLETIEDTYVSFRRQIELMVRNTTCPCNACRNIGSLDLKFFVHYGEFGLQHLDAHDELVGSDVNLIHRLLKNHVTERTGLRAYALYTEASIRQLGLEAAASGFIVNEESYEDLGTVRTLVQDMHPIWEQRRTEAQLRITAERELLRVAADIRVPPERVWSYVTQPEHFNVLLGGTRTEIADLRHGRVAEGSIYQCYHGDSVVAMTVLEWHPFEFAVVQSSLPIPLKGSSVLIEVRLEPIEGGTRFSQIFSKSSGPLLARLLSDIGVRSFSKQGQRDIEAFAAHIEADVAALAAPEPEAARIDASAISAAARDSLATQPG